MGIASYDVTGDGYPDYFITSQGDNKLQTLTAGPGQPTYRDIALKRGVTAAQPFTGGDVLPSTAWHPEFQDVNNDGFIDLFVSKGNVNAQPDYATEGPERPVPRASPTAPSRRRPTRPASSNYARGRGAALADFNLDGMLDLVEVNYGAPVRGCGGTSAPGDAAKPAQMGNWLARPAGPRPGPNRDAIGAWIEVQVGDADAAPRADGRRRPRRRAARLDPLRARPGRHRPRSASSGRTARWGRGCR